MVGLESHYKRSWMEHEDFLKYFQLSDKNYAVQFYQCNQGHTMVLTNSNPYGFEKKPDGTDSNKPCEITCCLCKKTIGVGYSFNHCTRCYKPSHGKNIR